MYLGLMYGLGIGLVMCNDIYIREVYHFILYLCNYSVITTLNVVCVLFSSLHYCLKNTPSETCRC